MKFEVKNVACGYGNCTVLENISFSMESGEILCILGPNGAGKSTLFKSILCLLPLQKGIITCDNKNLNAMSRAEIAKIIGYVPQAHNPTFPFKAMDIVTMGRTAHLGICASPSEEDEAIAENAFDILGISYLKDKTFTKMSGGEKQLVLIARALAQQPKMLIMDEPTNNLDFGNQVLVLSHIRKLAKQGLALIISTHFPEHAFMYSNKALLLKEGGLYSIGSPEKTITKESLEALYNVKVDMFSAKTSSGKEMRFCAPVENLA